MAPYKKKLRRYACKTKKIKDDTKVAERISDIMLFDSSKKHFYRYQVYLDNDIGIDRVSQDKLIECEIDEDCDSSDEIITDGINRALASLTMAITKKKG